MLMFAVMCWVSAFDLYYALQDIEFDRNQGLKSIPAAFGISRTMDIAGVLHVLSVLGLAFFGLLSGLGWFYWIGWVVAAVLVAREHYVVRRFGLLKVNQAFFDMNAWVSVIVFLAVLADVTSGKS